MSERALEIAERESAPYDRLVGGRRRQPCDESSLPPASRLDELDDGRSRIGAAGRDGARPLVAVLAVHYIRDAGRCFLGGAEKYLLQTVAALLDSGADVLVNYSGDNIYEELSQRFGPARLALDRTDWVDRNMGGDRRLSPRLIFERRRWFAARRPDVVFVVQQGHGASFGASVLAARSCGCRVVASIRQAPPPEPDVGRRPIWRMRTVAACCSTIIFNSRRIADAFVQRYGFSPRRVCVIRNGEPLAPRPRSLAAPDPALFIRADRAQRVMNGAIGQVSHHKGADVTFEAFAALADRHPRADLIYFGDGALIEPLRRRAEAAGLSRRVTFAGYEPDRERMYANIDVLVTASRRESSSNAVAEAMARGLPCIVSDAGGLPELVEHGRTGLVVPVGNPGALAAAMESLLADEPCRAAMGDAAHLRASRHFNARTQSLATTGTILGRANGTGFFATSASEASSARVV